MVKGFCILFCGKRTTQKAGYHRGGDNLPFWMIGRDAAHFAVAAGGQGTLSLCVCFRQHKGQFCGDGALAVHISRRFAHAHRAALFHQLAVQGEHVAGGDLLAEAGIFDAAEQGQLALVFGQAEGGHGPGLGQRSLKIMR